jgi:hypothetical protein
MALLHLPLSLSSSGTFDRAGTEENYVGTRLRVFLLAGMGQYLRLPSPGIRAMWLQLYSMGISARFRDSMEERERVSLENSIREELNVWFGETATITSVELCGDEREENGIRFRTTSREFTFTFHFALPGRGLGGGSIGPWNIIETSHAIG